MPRFEEHIKQAERNLRFLSSINQSIGDCLDWQVTVCFYTALHLVNAHLAKFNLQYRKHKDVNFALNFENRASPASLPESEYLGYTALQALSRRSRYLVSERGNNLNAENAFITYDRHLAKALRHLDKLLIYFSERYKINFQPTKVSCNVIRPNELRLFRS